jgi:hypothetical protein
VDNDKNVNGNLIFNSNVTKNTELNLNSSSSLTVESQWKRNFYGPHVHKNLLHGPQVFCEGVDRVETTGKEKLSPEAHGSLSTAEDTSNENSGKHFVVLKWNLNYEHLINASLKRDGETAPSKWSEKNDRDFQGKQTGESRSETKTLPVVFIIEKYSRNSGVWENVGKVCKCEILQVEKMLCRWKYIIEDTQQCHYHLR